MTSVGAESLTLKQQLVRKPLSRIELGKVSCEEMPFLDALQLLKLRVAKETEGAVDLQWVCQGFNGEEWEPSVTISLENISAGQLLALILRQTGLAARLDSYAIVLSRPETQKVASDSKKRKPFVPRSTALEGGGLEGPDWDQEPLKGRNPLKKSSREGEK